MRRIFCAALAAFALGASCIPASAQQQGDETEADAAKDVPHLLVYSKTSRFRHNSIDAGVAALVAVAKKRGWDLTVTENPEWFDPERLFAFDAIIWALPTGPTLDDEQKTAMRTFVEEHGRGFVGIHAAGDSSHEWQWYQEELIGPAFIGHPGRPNVRGGTVRVEAPDNPIMAGIPLAWERVDEWYSFDKTGRDKFNILATVDEATYDPPLEGEQAEKLTMGDHPIIWHRCVGEGRSFYSGLGHTVESFADAEHRMMLGNAIAWALGEGECPAG